MKKQKNFNRREMLKMGLKTGVVLGGSTLISTRGIGLTKAYGKQCTGLSPIEVFPTSPLILNPFHDPLPIPEPLAPSDPSTWATPPNPQTSGLQDSSGGVHQVGCKHLGLPDPVYYRMALRVGKHNFTTSPVLPIDKNGNPVKLPLGTTVIQNADGTVNSLPPSTIYGFNGTFPGPMIYASYGQPCCVRFVNELDQNPENLDRQNFGAEDMSFLTHLHNGHTAPESDGNPIHKPDGYKPQEWCDNLYLNWPAGGDYKEKQSFLWFHDHRMDHTGANVYKGMVGLYPIYDPINNHDNGDETKGYRLPGVRNTATGRIDYDIPIVIYDCRLDDGVTQHQDFHNGCGETHPEWWGKTFYRDFPNHGFVGDVFTVNGTAYPVFEVKRRRYRLRFLDASIARIYDLKLMRSMQGPVAAKDLGLTGDKLQGQYQLPDGQQCMKMVQIATDGGLLPYPILRNSIEIWPAKRREVIVDFSRYMDGTATKKGDVIYLVNIKQMTNGRKPNSENITLDDDGLPLSSIRPDTDFDKDFRVPVLKIIIGDDAQDYSFDPLEYPSPNNFPLVTANENEDDVPDNGIDRGVFLNNSCSLALNPDGLPKLVMRALPAIPIRLSDLPRRTFELQRSGKFGGEIQWLINNRPFDPTASLAFPILGAAELWTIKNGGGGWVHPMHLHMEEHRVISRNGVLTPQIKDPNLYNKTFDGHDRPDDIGKEDVVALEAGEKEVVVYRMFRTFKGAYVAHCHNLAHEDHAMMFGWTIV